LFQIGLQDMPEPIERPTLEFSVFFALSKVKLPRDRALSEDDRRALAKAVAEHFKLCRWEVMANPEAIPRAATYSPGND
jgi:hypothetical protein